MSDWRAQGIDVPVGFVRRYRGNVQSLLYVSDCVLSWLLAVYLPFQCFHAQHLPCTFVLHSSNNNNSQVEVPAWQPPKHRWEMNDYWPPDPLERVDLQNECLTKLAMLHSRGLCLRHPSADHLINLKILRPNLAGVWIQVPPAELQAAQRTDLAAALKCIRYGAPELDGELEKATSVTDLMQLIRKTMPEWIFPHDLPRAEITQLIDRKIVRIFISIYFRSGLTGLDAVGAFGPSPPWSASRCTAPTG